MYKYYGFAISSKWYTKHVHDDVLYINNILPQNNIQIFYVLNVYCIEPFCSIVLLTNSYLLGRVKESVAC